MINYKISEHLKKQLDNSKHNKYKEIQNFLYELLNPQKRIPYHLELQNFLGWIDSPEFMIKQIEGINDFVNKSKSYDQFIFIGMGASAILPELLLKEQWVNKKKVNEGFHDNKQSFKPKFYFIDGTQDRNLKDVINNYNKTLIFFVSKNGKSIETKTIMQNLINIPDISNNFIAITDYGSDLYNFAKSNNFQEIFCNPPYIPGRFSAFTYTGLIPAAISGINIKKMLESVIEFKNSIIKKDNPSLINLTNYLSKMLDCKINIVNLLSSNEKDPKLLWVQQMISESLAKNNRYFIPINSDLKKLKNRHDIVNIFFKNNKYSLEKINNENLIQSIIINNIDEENLGVFIYTIQLIITTLSFIEPQKKLEFNPFTQPNVELAKNEYGKNSISLPSLNEFQLPTPPNIKNLKYISFLIFTENSNNNKKFNKFREGISIEKEIIKKIMDKQQIPYFIDFAPAYLHTTGELHKKNIQNVYHIIIYTTPDDLGWEVNSDSNGLRGIIDVQLQSEIEIFKKNGLTFDIIHIAKLNEYLKNLF